MAGGRPGRAPSPRGRGAEAAGVRTDRQLGQTFHSGRDVGLHDAAVAHEQGGRRGGGPGVIRIRRIHPDTGTPGGRTIINTVLTTILNVIDFGMNAQEAVDAGRIHHQWLPDRLNVERYGFSADTIKMLEAMGHNVEEGGGQGAAQVIVFNQKENMLEGGVDRRPPDGGAAGK